MIRNHHPWLKRYSVGTLTVHWAHGVHVPQTGGCYEPPGVMAEKSTLYGHSLSGCGSDALQHSAEAKQPSEEGRRSHGAAWTTHRHQNLWLRKPCGMVNNQLSDMLCSNCLAQRLRGRNGNTSAGLAIIMAKVLYRIYTLQNANAQ